MINRIYWTILTLFVIVLFVAFYLTVSCKPPANKEVKDSVLDASLTAIMKEYGVVGCSLAVIKNNQNIYYYNYGLANIKTNETMSSNHSIRLASISKLLTSILLLNVLERHPSTNINEPISKLLEIPFNNPNFKDDKITLKELVSHTSSFSPNQTPSEEFINESIFNRGLNISEIIKSNGKYYRDYYWDDTFPPGDRYSYSGFNFLIIATILEKITKQRFNQLAHTILINKLQLQNTHLATSLPLAETKYAIGYNVINDIPKIALDDNKFQLRIVNKKYVIGKNPTIHSPQSSFRSNIVDLSKVMKMLLNNGVYENTRILNKDSIKLLETPIFKTTTIHRGLGTEINYQLIPGIKMVGHSGNAYGILTHFFYNREEDFGIIFIINGLKMLVYEEGGDHLQIEREIPKIIYDRLIKQKYESPQITATKNFTQKKSRN